MYETTTTATFVSANGKTVNYQTLFEGADNYLQKARKKGLVSEDEAADLFQDTALRIVRSSGRFDETRPYKVALYGGIIARNVRISEWQKSSRRPQVFSDVTRTDDDGSEYEPSFISGYRGDEYEADKEVCTSETIDFIQSRIDALSEEDRMVLELAMEGLKPKRIAQELGCTPNAVSIRLHKIRKVLARDLGDVLREYGMCA